ILGMCLLAVNLFQVLLASEQEPHVTVIAILSTLVVALLFSPVKDRIQEGIDRLFFRERYNSRRALLRLSQDLNADLDLARMAERLLAGVHDALGVSALSLFLPDEDGGFSMFKDLGCTPAACQANLPAGGSLVRALAAGEPVLAEAHAELYPEAGPLDLSHYFPCRVKGELIAILGVGRKDGFEPLNSEEVDVLQALAGQAATAVMNGRLYHSRREKADELQALAAHDENILESIDSGIIVLGLDGRVGRWNRAMESLYGHRRGEVL